MSLTTSVIVFQGRELLKVTPYDGDLICARCKFHRESMTFCTIHFMDTEVCIDRANEIKSYLIGNTEENRLALIVGRLTR